MSTKIVLSEDLIARPFTCDLMVTGMAAIDATGREKYVSYSVVAAMPCATAANGTLYFFRVKRELKVCQPAVEATKLGLRLADPHTLAAFNKANPEFADTHPNATEWLDENGIACYAAFRTDSNATEWLDENGIAYHAVFRRWDGDRRHVSIFQNDNDWHDYWWFAAVSE
jgi:hypothetical protein